MERELSELKADVLTITDGNYWELKSSRARGVRNANFTEPPDGKRVEFCQIDSLY